MPPGVEPGRQCPAAIALTGAFYRPIKYAPDVKCPALVIYAEQDTLISPDTTKSTAQSLQKATVIGLPIKHFDLYVGEVFEQVVRLEADFFQQHFAPEPRMSQ